MNVSSAKEPSCEHDRGQPASACRVCRTSPRLAEWKRYWREQAAADPELRARIDRLAEQYGLERG